MLIHIVLVKVKKGTSQSQINDLHKNVLELKNKIPGIKSISGGPDTSVESRNKGFNYGFVMEFNDSKALDNYLPHPEHQNTVKKYVRPNTDDVLVFDYNI